MSKDNVPQWDPTAGNNTDVGGVNIAENCPPSGINNAIRTAMAQVKLYAPSGHLYGLTLSNNGADATNDIDIAAGQATSDDASCTLMILASALTKRLDAAWAVGSGNGGLDTGAIADTTYHVWLIRRPDTAVVDALFSLSATAPTMPANYTQKRRIGSIIRVSATILAFTQVGDKFQVSPIKDLDGTTLNTTAISYTLTVPTGIKVVADCSFLIINGGGTTYVLATSLDQPDVLPEAGRADMVCEASYSDTASKQILTNTSAQIRGRSSRATTAFSATTHGWTDTRGRLA